MPRIWAATRSSAQFTSVSQEFYSPGSSLGDPSKTSGVMGRSGMEPDNVGAPPLEEMWEESNTPT
jgi:hypothetical protein